MSMVPAVRTLLKREESYAIHALINMTENPGTTAQEIAEDLQAPRAFMSKVLRKLTTAGLIETRMGRGGGVRMLKDPYEITILDVMEVISGPVIMDHCQVKDRCATQQRLGHCKLKGKFLSSSILIREILSKTSIAELSNVDVQSRQQLQPAVSSQKQT